MAYCPKCGKPYEGSPAYCPSCGHSLLPPGESDQVVSQVFDAFYPGSQSYFDLYFTPDRIVAVNMGSTWVTWLVLVPMGAIIGLISVGHVDVVTSVALTAVMGLFVLLAIYAVLSRLRLNHRFRLANMSPAELLKSGPKNYEVARSDISEVALAQKGRFLWFTFVVPGRIPLLRFRVLNKRTEKVTETLRLFAPDKLNQPQAQAKHG